MYSSLLAFAAAGALLAQAPQPTPTQQRLEQLEQADRAAKAAEAKEWRTFPKPVEGGAFNPLEPDSWLMRQIQPYDRFATSCDYHWTGWKLEPATGIRNTRMRCRGSYAMEQRVAVNCTTLKVAGRSLGRDGWGPWQLPRNEGERQMVIALCDEVAAKQR